MRFKGNFRCCPASALQEYIGMVSAKGIAAGSPPPPPLVTSAISLLCVALNAWVFVTNGRNAAAMAVATFLILSLQLLVVRKPRFAQLTSSLFGLFYCGGWGWRCGGKLLWGGALPTGPALRQVLVRTCKALGAEVSLSLPIALFPGAAGYLPSFWIKLRLMAAPAANSGAIAAAIPAVLGGPTHLTVGLLAAFVAVACIIAADTGAYFTGKSFGRTQVRQGSGQGSGQACAPAPGLAGACCGLAAGGSHALSPGVHCQGRATRRGAGRDRSGMAWTGWHCCSALLACLPRWRS